MSTPCRDTGVRGDVLGYALAYAARGWHVIPLVPGTSKRPACPDHCAQRCTGADPRCARAGRHVTWEERATTDPGRITRAWTAHRYGIGIATGPSGLVVIDLDVPKGPAGQKTRDALGALGLGPDSTGSVVLALLADRADGTVPPTYTVRTPSGGTHLYYALPPGRQAPSTVGALGPRIDTRGAGGQVAAPPTRTPTGGYALALDVPPVPVPVWLLDHLAPARTAPAGPAPTTLTRSLSLQENWDGIDRYLNAALVSTLGHLAGAEEGGRNRALYAAACSLGRLAAGNPARADWAEAVERELTAAALHLGLGAHETARTLASGLGAGARAPRTIHPREAA